MLFFILLPKIYQILDKHQNLSVQFVYLLIIQEIRANQDYEGNNIDLPSRSPRAVATSIWRQITNPGNPGNTKEDTAEKLEYMATKLEVIVCWLILADIMATGARYEITRVEMHKLMTKLKKN